MESEAEKGGHGSREDTAPGVASKRQPRLRIRCAGVSGGPRGQRLHRHAPPGQPRGIAETQRRQGGKPQTPPSLPVAGQLQSGLMGAGRLQGQVLPWSPRERGGPPTNPPSPHSARSGRAGSPTVRPAPTSGFRNRTLPLEIPNRHQKVLFADFKLRFHAPVFQRLSREHHFKQKN